MAKIAVALQAALERRRALGEPGRVTPRVLARGNGWSVAGLREATIRLAARRGKVLDLAFDCGFGDVSNFNRTLRSEFGLSPRAHQRRA